MLTIRRLCSSNRDIISKHVVNTCYNLSLRVVFTCLVFSFATISVAQESNNNQSSELTIETTITGNQEQPKVLYIVPWQAAKDPTILYQPLKSRVRNVFEHVDRSEHQREIEFLDTLEKSPN